MILDKKKSYWLIIQAHETPIKRVKKPTPNINKDVLSKYENNFVFIRCFHTSILSWYDMKTIAIIGKSSKEIIKKEEIVQKFKLLINLVSMLVTILLLSKGMCKLLFIINYHLVKKIQFYFIMKLLKKLTKLFYF